MRRLGLLVLVGWLALLVAVPSPQARGCSICEGNSALRSPTFRQEAVLPQARLILYGTIANPRATGGLAGETDFQIVKALRADPAIKGKKVLVLPRYLPVPDRKSPPQYVLFADLDGAKLDPYRGVRVLGKPSVEYLEKALALRPKESTANLLFFFRHLDHPDPEVSRDAFLEFAKASDADIAAAASKFDAKKIRAWIDNENTEAVRIGVYALLLGACGREADAEFLRGLLDRTENRYVSAADGILAGYAMLKPDKGWALAHGILADGKKSLVLRLSVLRALRFLYGAKPEKARAQVVKAMKAVLAQGELADLAAEDLRKLKIWDLTAEVLKLYGQKVNDSVLVRHAIIRYALCAPESKETAAFLKARRAAEADDVKEVEEGLALERKAAGR